MSALKRPCSCHSGHTYAACCAPFHAGEREADTPEQLMRSRYAAFALGLGEYLVKTLAASHPDLQLKREELIAGLSRANLEQRFVGLRILHTMQEDTRGEVLFFAKIYTRGADASFAELSEFTKENGAWRYASGLLLERSLLPKALNKLDRESFLLCHHSLGGR